MKIGVGGASGQLGTAVLKELKARGGHQLVGISRTPDKVAVAGIETRPGDFDKPDELVGAYAGLDRLLLIPTVDLRKGARQRQYADAIHAANKAGVGHVVLMSATGARGLSPSLWDAYFGGEQLLMRTTKQWSILRMAYYAESFVQAVQGALPHGALAGLSTTPVNFVWRDDIAAAAAGILAGDGHHGAIYNATGPRSYSGEERAAAASKALGKPLPYAVVPREVYAGGLKQAGLPAELVDTVLYIEDAYALGGFDITTGDVERLSGRKPRTLEEMLATAF